MTKKANTDPTFPAPPANPPKGWKEEDESIDDLLDSLGAAKRHHVVHDVPMRTEHVTIPNEAVIVREVTKPGLGDPLQVTPEERARLDEMIAMRAAREKEPLRQLKSGNRADQTIPRYLQNKPPPVTTDPRKHIPRKPLWPVALMLALAACVIVGIVWRGTAPKTTSNMMQSAISPPTHAADLPAPPLVAPQEAASAIPSPTAPPTASAHNAPRVRVPAATLPTETQPPSPTPTIQAPPDIRGTN